MDTKTFIEKLTELFSRYKLMRTTETDLTKEFYNLLGQNYDVYLKATPKQCEEIRRTVSNCYLVDNRGNIVRLLENLLLHYISEKVIEEMHSSGDKTWLLRGLAAISIENSGVDYRDSLIRLAGLYIAAEDKDINPSSAFEKVSKISSKEKPRGGSISMSEMMASVHSLPILNERRSNKFKNN